MYYITEFSRESIESQINEMLKIHSQNAEHGYISTVSAIETVISYLFVEEAWNTKNDCPATKFTSFENYGFRYHYNNLKTLKTEENVVTRETAEAICLKVLQNMAKANIIIFSKSGKGVKYINE